MILAAVDDLLFSSKIRTTAKGLGLELAFARTPDAVVAEAERLAPQLVIFDLNSERVQALEAISRLKADPDLRAIRVVGFVSHVDAPRIAAARAAGADEVMPRSAFAANLAEILTSAR